MSPIRWWPSRRRTPRRAEFVCREMVELMTAYLDEALEPDSHAAFERHLAGCPHCSAYLAQIQLVREAAGRVEPEDVPAGARRDLMALYQNWRADPLSESPEGSSDASE